jgi:hypothetical protein
MDGMDNFFLATGLLFILLAFIQTFSQEIIGFYSVLKSVLSSQPVYLSLVGFLFVMLAFAGSEDHE